MAAIKDLDDLYLHTLRDILYAERQVQKALPKMIRSASADDVKAALEAQNEDIDENVARLERAFDRLDKAPRGARCEAILGIIGETEELMDEVADGMTRDAAMISAMQAMRHYEITRYGTLAAWAKTLGREEAAADMKANADAAEKADQKLSKIAKGRVNKAAA